MFKMKGMAGLNFGMSSREPVLIETVFVQVVSEGDSLFNKLETARAFFY